MALLDYRFVDLQLCNRSLWTFGLLMFFGGCQPQIHFRSLHQLGLKLLYILHGLILYFFEFLLSRVDCWLIWVPSGINLYVWSLCSSFLAWRRWNIIKWLRISLKVLGLNDLLLVKLDLSGQALTQLDALVDLVVLPTLLVLLEEVLSLYFCLVSLFVEDLPDASLEKSIYQLIRVVTTVDVEGVQSAGFR